MRREEAIKDSRILIVDDEEANVILLERFLSWAGYRNVLGVMDSEHALRLCYEKQPDLVVLDLQMPGMDGFELLSRLREQNAGDYLPVLVFTADINPESKTRALQCGASDFLTKPGDVNEITLRVRNFLETKQLHRELRERNTDLENLIVERTRALEKSRLDALQLLARASEFRDDDTGEHAKRVGDLAAEIALRLDGSDLDPEVVRLAAPLHDIGKIGVPDSILGKPGKLTPEEFEIMKAHTTIGAHIIGQTASPILEAAKVIALTHHERTDGTGYPNGLHGELIPVIGRVVAVADVFDALTHKRPYKQPWSCAEAADFIRSWAGVHFDAKVVEAFDSLGWQTMSLAA